MISYLSKFEGIQTYMWKQEGRGRPRKVYTYDPEGTALALQNVHPAKPILMMEKEVARGEGRFDLTLEDSIPSTASVEVTMVESGRMQPQQKEWTLDLDRVMDEMVLEALDG